jgi:hypothetical protein
MGRHKVLTALVFLLSLILWVQLITAQVKANAIEADVKIVPEALLLKKDGYGKWMTAYVSFKEKDYHVKDIDMSSVVIEITDVGEEIPLSWYRVEGERLIIKFDRALVRDIILGSPLIQHMSPRVKEQVTFKIRGDLISGLAFEGTDKIFIFFTQEAHLLENE